MAWALTGAFSNDDHSKHSAVLVESRLKDIKDLTEKKGSTEEKEYVPNAMALIESSVRSLDTVYKGRELNFQENEKLRSAYLDSITETVEFGKKSQDFLKSLPSVSIGAAGGVTVGSALGLSEIHLWAIGIVLGAAGYIINLGFVRRARRQRQLLYLAQDYERSLYYDQYITRISAILTALYLDIERLHKKVFGEPYHETEAASPGEAVSDLINSVRPTFCKFVHKHMLQKKITPELWALCETGGSQAVQTCPLWEK
jgi:hypothetical protein